LWLFEKTPPRWVDAFRCLAIFLPAAVHALIRWKLYGEIIPLPVLFKSTGGDLFFLAVGARNLLADFVATHGLALLLLSGTIRATLSRRQISSGSSLPDKILVTLFFCVIPYYFSGGDWFPSYWARYLFPFILFLFCRVVMQVAEAYQKLPARDFYPVLAPAFLLMVFTSFWPISTTHKALDLVFSHRRTLAMIQEPTIARGHYRVHALSQLGEHFRRTTLPSDRIGTSELATLFFFSEREGVDFLGLMNPDIARSPLRRRPSWFRRFPYHSELPFLIFKRLDSSQLEKHQPEFLYTFDFMLRDQFKDVRAYELDPPTLIKALTRWEKQLGGLADELYGGLKNIHALGYQMIVIRAGDDFTTLYFVHQRALARHLAALETAGYRGNTYEIPHPF
jgi:hypothetical protein